jgi:S1-C subfamily serine protease
VVTTVPAAGSTSAVAPADGVDPLQTLPDVLEHVSPSVVAIDVVATTTGWWGGTTTTESAGTGFVFAAGGLIATCAHVVEGAEQISVTYSDGTSQSAQLVGADPVADLAVIRVDRDDLVPLPLATNDTLRVGELVVAVGNALALEGSPTVTVGIVSALDRKITVWSSGAELEHLIQTDAAISSGDSGGPLLSATGAVIGIDTAVASSGEETTAQNIGFAIPITTATPILVELAGS